MNAISFVVVTLADPTAPKGTTQLLRLPALVQDIDADGKAALTVFANVTLAKHLNAPCILLEGVELDPQQLKAPSYARGPAPASVIQPPVSTQPVAPTHNDFGVPGVPQGKVGGLPTHGNVQGHGLKVFGKGTMKQSVSHSRQVFRSAGDALARGGEISEATIASLGSPVASMPGQRKPRIFVKGKGEITKAAPEPTESDALASILGLPPTPETLTEASGANPIVFNGDATQNGTPSVSNGVPQQHRESSGGRPL
jgi:hypothetical protein